MGEGPTRPWLEPRTLDRELLAAAQSPDPLALERAAARLGVRGLREALASGRTDRQRAAALAAPQLHESWYLLGAVAELLRHADPAVREAAAAATRAISEDLRPALLARYEESAATLGPAIATLLGVAQDPRLPSPGRVAALEALAQLGHVMKLDEGALVRLLKAPDAAVRAAAVQALAAGRSLTMWASLAQVLAHDDAVEVARAAAVAICSDLPTSRKERALAVAALRNEGAFDRLRELAARRDAAVDERVEIAACLAHSADRRDRRVQRRLLRDPVVRRALARARR